MRSLILGTAGHIDHGKTALVRRLTGIDTDRLIEEKRRGITIELGFAHLELGDIRFGIVDVPGHERFIKSMVAGAGGIDVVMLVVAADEGVMPQTREHLDICKLLGVKRGLVALTKADLVDEEWRDLVVQDLRETLDSTFLGDAPIVPCSSLTGQGMDALQDALSEIGCRCPDRETSGLLRLPLDRVFTMKGFGTIVTGSLVSGTLREGETVAVLPSAVTATTRRIQVHGHEEAVAVAGQRTAVNLGGVDRRDVARGEVLAHPGTLEPSSIIDAEISLLPSARKPLRVRSHHLFHLGTRQQEANVVLLEERSLEPGTTGLAQLSFDRPIVALPGDRFILRGFVKQENHGTTVGGGEILHVGARRLRPRDTERIALIASMRGAAPRERLALEVLAAGPLGLTRADLGGRLPLTPTRIDALVGELLSTGKLIRFDREKASLIHLDHLTRLEDRALDILDYFHETQPLERGIGREELRTRLSRDFDTRLFFTLLSRLDRRGVLQIERDIVRRPHHEVKASVALEPLADKILSHCRHGRLAAPRDAELVEKFGAGTETTRTAIKLLVDQGKLIRLGKLLFAQESIADLETALRAYLDAHETIDPPAFKALVGQSRKFVIPLAEFFDAQKVTIRIGDLRRLRE
ncbi:MAG: selenocysteine-specific translation elongation factor [Deltaproteobacteria bacterium]|nr:selenocysteine-specific translation elongation factor [Deltaproteobacteria bacterium]